MVSGDVGRGGDINWLERTERVAAKGCLFYLFMYLSFWLFFVFVISFGFVGADSGRGWGH